VFVAAVKKLSGAHKELIGAHKELIDTQLFIQRVSAVKARFDAGRISRRRGNDLGRHRRQPC
jgi:hypothetical protein